MDLLFRLMEDPLLYNPHNSLNRKGSLVGFFSKLLTVLSNMTSHI